MKYVQRKIRHNNLYFSYLRAGAETDPVIILIHGVSGSAKDMLGVAKGLVRKGYSVVMPNLPGHMDSDFIDAQEFTDLAQWLHDFITALNLKHPPRAIIGNSLAAAVCYEYVALYGIAPQTKVFLVVPTPLTTPPVRLFQSILVALPNSVVGYIYDKPVLNHLRVNYALVTKDKSIRRRVLESERRKEFLDVRILRYPVLLSNDNPFQRLKVDEDLQGQLVVLCGQQDNVAGKKSFGVLQDVLPHSKMVVVPRTGHIMHFEAEDAYVQHVHVEVGQ